MKDGRSGGEERTVIWTKRSSKDQLLSPSHLCIEQQEQAACSSSQRRNELHDLLDTRLSLWFYLLVSFVINTPTAEAGNRQGITQTLLGKSSLSKHTRVYFCNSVESNNGFSGKIQVISNKQSNILILAYKGIYNLHYHHHNFYSRSCSNIQTAGIKFFVNNSWLYLKLILLLSRCLQPIFLPLHLLQNTRAQSPSKDPYSQRWASTAVTSTTKGGNRWLPREMQSIQE